MNALSILSIFTAISDNAAKSDMTSSFFYITVIIFVIIKHFIISYNYVMLSK